MRSIPLNVVITGGNSGIGFETMKYLYLQGHNIIFGSRNQSKNQQAISLIEKEKSLSLSKSSKNFIKSFPLDLSVKKSIQGFVQFIKSHYNNVDILINNAGIAMNQLKRNEDNVEMTLAISYFGHFYLTNQLFELLKRSKQARIINLCSDSHYQALKNALSDIECTKKSFSMLEQTFISKFMVAVFTHELGKRLSSSKTSHIKTVCLNPGAVSTNFDQGICLLKVIFYQAKQQMMKILCCCMFVSPEKGAFCSIFLSTEEFSVLKNGEYYDNKKNHKEMDKKAKDGENGRKLWEISENLYKIKFIVE